MTLRKAIPGRTTLAALAVFAVAALLRLAAATPGMLRGDAERFSRPDTPGYLAEAEEFATSGRIHGTGRVPGFPLVASFFIDGRGKLHFVPLVVFLSLVGAATGAVVFLAGNVRSFGVGLAAGLLHASNLTAIVNSPMLLSDTLFGLLAAAEFLFFMHIWVKKRFWCFFPMVGIAALGVLFRPINLAWFFPAAALLLLTCDAALTWRKKAAFVAGGAAIFAVVVCPWMLRNAALGAGFTSDTNTGAMRHQNGAMLTAEVNGTDFESEKARLLDEEKREFADAARYPDEASREAWRLREYRKMVLAHPLLWLRQSASWRIFIPDAATFWELCGVTSSGRGTMGVMAKHGFFAGVRHYFGGSWTLLLLTLLLLIPVVVLYACALGRVVCDICRIREYWYELVVFLAFAEYYLLLPGAITAPRYQIPALPVLCVLAGLFVTERGRDDAPAEAAAEDADNAPKEASA